MHRAIKKRLNDEFKTVSHYIEIYDTDEQDELKRYEIEKKLQCNNNLDFCYKSKYRISIDQLGLAIALKSPFICNELYFDSVKAKFFTSGYISIDLEFYLANNMIFHMHYFLIESPHFYDIHAEINKTLIAKLSRALTALDAIKEQNQTIDEMIKTAIQYQFSLIDFKNAKSGVK